jgi:molybdopterin-guanine dinucleotide biosynthesis protein A
MVSAGIAPSSVCAVLLAGGRGSRMGGVDKGLQPLHGQALAAIALQRLRQQAGGPPGLIAINANRNQSLYAAMGVPVWADTVADFAGPLAGFLVAMERSQGRHEYVLSVPCDSPRFPLDLLQRLSSALVQEQAELAMALAPEAQAEGSMRLLPQPVFCLMRSSLLGSLQEFVASGGRKIGAWAATRRQAKVGFNTAADDPRAFTNANTLDDLRDLERA